MLQEQILGELKLIRMKLGKLLDVVERYVSLQGTMTSDITDEETNERQI